MRIIKYILVIWAIFLMIGFPMATVTSEGTPSADIDAVVTFLFIANHSQEYKVEISNFNIPDKHPRKETFDVKVEREYNIGTDQLVDYKYEIVWQCWIDNTHSGDQKEEWKNITISWVHGEYSAPGDSGSDEYIFHFDLTEEENCVFSAYCFMSWSIFTWDYERDMWTLEYAESNSDYNETPIDLQSTGCPEGTQITMPSGIGPITKSIEDIEVGEFILSYDPISQVTTAAEVIEVCIYTEGLPDHNLIFNGNLEVTPSHNLYINGIGWMEAENAQMGYYMLRNTLGIPDIYPVAIFSKEPSTGPAGPIYDLVIQPLAGEAIGYWADGILVGGYN